MGYFREISTVIISEGKQEDLIDVLDNYFIELEEYYPTTYKSLMSEFKKLTSKANINSKEELDMYLAHIHHDDYPSDKYWTVEDTTKVGEQVGVDFTKWRYNKFSFNFVMNMVKADYLEELTKMFKQSTVLKQTVLDNPVFYAHLAKAWLDDEDAPNDKLMRYIHFIVLREDSIDEEVK